MGLPGKNIRPFLGLPLIAHSILLARMCPAIDRVVVSTDSEEISRIARHFEAETPFVRPADLSRDDTPMWPVLRHSLSWIEESEGRSYTFLMLLDPTSPGRLPEDVTGALRRLQEEPSADGIIGVSQPEFNPLWHCVKERDGWMVDLFEDAVDFGCRQETPTVYRINASLYAWRADFVRREKDSWRSGGRHLIYEIPEVRSIHIDDLQEFEKAEILVRQGLLHFPWLNQDISKCVPSKS